MKFLNSERLVHAMEARGLDAIVATTANNVFYLSGFNGIAHKSDEPRPYAVLLSRQAPNEPVLIVADYYIGTLAASPTWIEDQRSFRAVMLPLDLPASPDDLDRFIPAGALDQPWLAGIRSHYADSIGQACCAALRDLGVERGRVGFDDLRFGYTLALDKMTVADGYDSLMYARSVKTPAETNLMKRATDINEAAIMRAIGAWDRGMSWREFNRAYHVAAVDLGGFVRDPGAMVWGQLRGDDAAITLQAGVEDFEIEAGSHVLFDCHGTAGMYCWDGGKTWVVGGEPTGAAKSVGNATAEVAQAVITAMRPGVRISELQACGREVFRKCGVASPDSALIFFHGLGLSHMDLEQVKADGQQNVDWVLEAGMIVPLHVLYPGGERDRIWLEEVVEVCPEGGKAYFSWGLDPIIRAA